MNKSTQTIFIAAQRLAKKYRACSRDEALRHGFKYTALTSLRPDDIDAMRDMERARALDGSAIDKTYNMLRWRADGFQIVEPDEMLAAVLMCTDFGGAVPVPPWSSFAVELPRGMVSDDGEEYTTALLTIADTDSRSMRLDIYGATQCIHSCYDTFADFCKANEADSIVRSSGALDLDRSPQDCRLVLAVSKLIVGVMFEFESSPSSFRRRALSLSEKLASKKAHAAPWVMCRPVVVDCREHVSDYVSDRARGKLSVRTLVRGHWRRQACGKARLERKLIHIEPFWKGPEDGPIAVRSHVIRGAA